jgi:DNA-3-methyladenine glycosylase II
METPAPVALTDDTLAAAVAELAARDSDLAGIVARYGLPPMWDRRPGFPTLVQLILEQQVSLASAGAAYARLCAEIGIPTAAGILELPDARFLAAGFSRQKAAYVRGLALAMERGDFDVEALERVGDDEARGRLVALKGIGPWTADNYLLMALRRPDVWPASDIALAAAIADIRGLAARPSQQVVEAIGLAWRPWRSVAARLLWLDYLRRRGRWMS